MQERNFIDENLINKLLEEKRNPPKKEINKILDKALLLKGLELKEVAALINIHNEKLLEKLFSAALKIKKGIYGNRLVLFTPLYVSNYCSNNCLYCGFRINNKEMKRKILSLKEIQEETKLILKQGHKRILMLMGEHQAKCSLDYFIKSLKEVYKAKDSTGSSIRRINVEISPLTENEFRKLSKTKIGTYTCFQETYHKDTYKKMHLTGKKSDYLFRLNVMDRALKNGLNDVGIGALFGLYDYRFEVMALIMHSKHLDEKYGVGPHTISIPRIEPAQNAPAALNPPFPVSDKNFKKLVAVLRCAVPYTGMILTTREPPKIRTQVFDLGVSQISAGSKTNPGGYKENLINPENQEQFSLNDTRPTNKVIKAVIKQGFVPSFCTACYRLGRVGEDFMSLAKPGLIQLNCIPNSILTLKEYLIDYADEETKNLGKKIIQKELEKIANKNRKKKTIEYLERIEKGERDLYF